MLVRYVLWPCVCLSQDGFLQKKMAKQDHANGAWREHRDSSFLLPETTSTTTTVLRPFVRHYPVEPVPEETSTHPPSWLSSNLYQLLPSTMIHSILLVQITCLAIFLHNLFPCLLWSTTWSGTLHLIFHTFLHPVSVFFSQHMPIPSQPVAVVSILYHLFS